MGQETMAARSASECVEPTPESFDTRAYLLARYGLHMNKKEVCFERKRSRATIDNMRNPRHPSFDRRLADAQVDADNEAERGVPVLFKTPLIADWLDAISQRMETPVDTNSTAGALIENRGFLGTCITTRRLPPGITQPGHSGSYVL
jgi:hypothetical protein